MYEQPGCIQSRRKRRREVFRVRRKDVTGWTGGYCIVVLLLCITRIGCFNIASQWKKPKIQFYESNVMSQIRPIHNMRSSASDNGSNTSNHHINHQTTWTERRPYLPPTATRSGALWATTNHPVSSQYYNSNTYYQTSSPNTRTTSTTTLIRWKP